MENQINVGDQNTQQIGQNPINQPTEVQVKPKFNYWAVSTIVFAVLFMVMVGVFAINYVKVKNNRTYLPSPTPEVSQTPSVVKQQPTGVPTAIPTTNLKLEDFANKEMLGENDNYSVYLINPKGGDTPEKTGELIVYDKKNKIVVKITGAFSIFGSTIVINDKKGEYVLLSTGTSMSRGIIPLSLAKKALAVKEFCATSDFLFYKDYVIYGNCDTFQNRPWEAGQAASLIALNFKTGQEKTITKSDLTHQYGPTKVVGDTLYYLDTFVTKEEDWQNPDNQKTVSKTYSLLSL
ncbi:hypothetical protein COY59_03215 [Candidatus Gottesmanbacteria bacterium CG_4_10_14_0_8_um_filter_37_24]|uniref:Uncharacterized protein n=1 Tax=Candidatus Gottesmanbacteria bacterium CG_4_10_14_0_8_um_filter_37_24 TaxID=1974574 RepID=A0A2M7RQY1_9BACT|nr:MAG: hypothetical protein COX23_02560 [Candidatus Gottesmanbacteria bacterium CG23_combo_of_CG06-09_8_20_14_all_37_19]PIZ02721.1 MAG: hypothetical protein COY59_03215 [Candidatus Gottesmanbacteria bacterium CG_4_10_14_0_8_um_filter_37_24]